ncbi:response regulator transcription factor [Spirosoma sp. SC4-14]|uniref:response regulator transcription factor n=1 Tax=Spirosoma sp. SC4-14 TaxID=3128900 RepID=UPI0030D4217C
MPTSIAITDDHHLMAEALADLINKLDDYEVLYIAENGRDLLEQLARGPLPDIALVDLHMPEMDGFETALQLRKLYPTIRVLALSMNDREEYVVRMLRNGARGYLLKGCRPAEFRLALDAISTKGYYYSDFLASQLINNLNASDTEGSTSMFALNGREQEFVKLACSELTYTEIADQMCVSPRTVDGYREVVFQKMGVKTRVGMVIEAFRNGLVEL